MAETVRRRCQDCGEPLEVRLAGQESGTRLVLLCAGCLASRVEAVQAEREQPKMCPQGHVIAGDNVLLSNTHGKRYAKCRACHRAWSAQRGARRTAERQAQEGGAA